MSSGYEEVVQIPKGSVFIHIQELNVSLNYLGESFNFRKVLELYTLENNFCGTKCSIIWKRVLNWVF